MCVLGWAGAGAGTGDRTGDMRVTRVCNKVTKGINLCQAIDACNKSFLILGNQQRSNNLQNKVHGACYTKS